MHSTIARTGIKENLLFGLLDCQSVRGARDVGFAEIFLDPKATPESVNDVVVSAGYPGVSNDRSQYVYVKYLR